MARNPTKTEEPQGLPEMPTPQKIDNQNLQVIEREVNLGLINDKLNYITGLLHKVAEACEVDINN